MYTKYYGLTRKPFENTPDPHFLFLSKNHREVLAALTYGINAAKGFVFVVGDIGTGKTTLIHALIKELAPSFIVLNIINPRATFNDILEYLAKNVGVTFEKAGAPDTMEAIRNSLGALQARDRRAVLLIDEAHLLSDEALEDIRLISNIENEEKKLIQIVLIGQNELNDKLQKDSLKPLKQRLGLARRLLPLDRKETEEYILHRLRIAGGESQLFEKKALSLIWKKSRGIPRLINQICDNAMLIGYAVETRSIGGKILKEVIGDMDSVHKAKPYGPSLFLRRIKWIGLAAVAVLFTVYLAVNFISRERFSSEILVVRKDSFQIKKEITPPPARTLGKKTRYSFEDGSRPVEIEMFLKQREVNPVANETEDRPADRPAVSEKERFPGKNESVVPEKQAATDRESGTHGESKTGAEESNGTKLLQKPFDSEELPAEKPQLSDKQHAAGDHESLGLGKQVIISKERSTTSESHPGAGEKSGINLSHEQINSDKDPSREIAYMLGDIKKSHLDNRKKVRPNECLSDLARSEYGIGNESIFDRIQMANPRIRNVNKIYPGQEIILPHIERKDLIVKDEKGLYHIHYASFFDSGEIAERCVQNLIKEHHEAFVIPVKQGENLVYRVYLGVFKSIDDAEKVLDKIELKYFDFLSKEQNNANHTHNVN